MALNEGQDNEEAIKAKFGGVSPQEVLPHIPGKSITADIFENYLTPRQDLRFIYVLM